MLGRFALALVLLLVMVTSNVLFYNSVHLQGESIRRAVSFFSGLILFFCIGFNALIVYPYMFFKGATGPERVVGSLLTFIIWMIKELFKAAEFFTLGESIYYGFSSLFLLILFTTLGQDGICELICRRIARKKGDYSGSILTPLPLLAILMALVAIFVLFIWGVGVHWFYIYMEGYKFLFH